VLPGATRRRASFRFRESHGAADGTLMLPCPIWREAFINDADEVLAKSSYDSLSPEPYQPHCDKLDLVRFYATKIPKSYLNGTEDHALPQGAENPMFRLQKAPRFRACHF
jgi:hypothetical protein